MKNYTAKEIKPSGWLKKQLEIQAKGLSGNLHKVWPDIKDSSWIGGSCEGWERVPYWLDGFIPLAYLLEDEEMIEVARNYVDAIIGFQQPDGWLCPCSEEERAKYDTWALILISKVLVVYAECSGEEEKIADVLERALKNFSEHINYAPLKNWGRTRYFEAYIAIKWLYDRTHEDWLLKLAYKLKVQGADWDTLIEYDVLSEFGDKWNYFSHVVNIAMMLKAYALSSDFFGNDADEFAQKAYAYLMKRYGTAYGHFNGDECLAPSSPLRGSELCSVVEAMYSYEVLFAKTENNEWLDRLEVLAYNGLPATISTDMWTHQYVQQVNQVKCVPMNECVFGSVNNEAHIFGLEPNFGCCTANFSQGWPKLTLSTFMKTQDGIMAAAVAPAILSDKINGVNVCVEAITEYPFRNAVTYQIKCDKPVEFEFSFRIPSCVKSAEYDGKKVKVGDTVKIKRIWADEKIEVAYNFESELVERPNGLFCLKHGPLLYSVPIKGKYTAVEYVSNGVERKYPYCDYRIEPMSKWNYGFCNDGFEIKINEYSVPFSDEKPPISISAHMKEVKWELENGDVCSELPDLTSVSEAIETVELIPYGCTTLRMTEMPILK